MTSDLVAFLSARLDEDEAAAKAAKDAARQPWQAGHWDEMCPEDADHYGRHVPARTLREVEAERAIIAQHGPADGGRDADRCRVCTAITHTGAGQTDARRFRAPCPTLLSLAAVYSDHPDYRDEWRPTP